MIPSLSFKHIHYIVMMQRPTYPYMHELSTLFKDEEEQEEEGDQMDQGDLYTDYGEVCCDDLMMGNCDVCMGID